MCPLGGAQSGQGRPTEASIFSMPLNRANRSSGLALPGQSIFCGWFPSSDIPAFGIYSLPLCGTIGDRVTARLPGVGLGLGEGVPVRSIAVMNQKGGVGKTTTSVNLAAGLARQGKRVCLLDLDPQAHASLHLGVELPPNAPTIYHTFLGERSLQQIRRLVGPQLWLAPASIDLAAAELELADTQGRELILRQALDDLFAVESYDYVIMDCPPSLGVLTVNALSAAREVFIPLQPHFLALHGLSKLLETTALVTRRLNRDLRVSGIVLCMYETNTRLAADVAGDLQTFLSSSDPEAPWANGRIFSSRVRRNIKLAEAPSFGKSIFDYAARCPGADDYLSLVQEVIAMEQVGEFPLARAA